MLNFEQEQLIEDVECYLHSDDPTKLFYNYNGLAGTGKTTVLSHLKYNNLAYKLCAFTGKASHILSQKSGTKAQTVHSLFYKLIDTSKKDKNGKPILEWTKAHGHNQLVGQVILLDENSMINTDMAVNILHSGAKLVTCGDHGQLHPVTGNPAFIDVDRQLNTIHRQAQDSPIIRQAYRVRDGKGYCNDTDKLVTRAQEDIAEMNQTDIILCFKNDTRYRINDAIRKFRGFWGDPKMGEPILCCKNNHKFGIYNGAVYQLAADYDPRVKEITLWIDDQELTIPSSYFLKNGETAADYYSKKGCNLFDYGYALTVHKSQGSEWPSVYLVDEYSNHFGKDNRMRWLYTAITRAADSLIIKTPK